MKLNHLASIVCASLACVALAASNLDGMTWAEAARRRAYPEQSAPKTAPTFEHAPKQEELEEALAVLKAQFGAGALMLAMRRHVGIEAPVNSAQQQQLTKLVQTYNLNPEDGKPLFAFEIAYFRDDNAYDQLMHELPAPCPLSCQNLQSIADWLNMNLPEVAFHTKRSFDARERFLKQSSDKSSPWIVDHELGAIFKAITIAHTAAGSREDLFPTNYIGVVGDEDGNPDLQICIIQPATIHSMASPQLEETRIQFARLFLASWLDPEMRS